MSGIKTTCASTFYAPDDGRSSSFPEWVELVGVLFLVPSPFPSPCAAYFSTT